VTLLDEVESTEGERREMLMVLAGRRDGMDSLMSTWDCEGMLFNRGIDRRDRERGRSIVDQNGALPDALGSREEDSNLSYCSAACFRGCWVVPRVIVEESAGVAWALREVVGVFGRR